MLVDGEKKDALDRGLGDEQAVEGVFVNGRKAKDGDRVLAGYRQFGVSAGEELSRK